MCFEQLTPDILALILTFDLPVDKDSRKGIHWQGSISIKHHIVSQTDSDVPVSPFSYLRHWRTQIQGLREYFIFTGSLIHRQ